MRFCALAPHDKDRFQSLVSYIAEEHYVDDVSWIHFAKNVVSSRVPNDAYVYDELRKLFLEDRNTDFFEFYAKIWVLSKYGNASDLLVSLRENFELWSPDETLGRLVGGLYPIFKQDGIDDDLDRIIARSNNKSAIDIFSFHHAITIDRVAYLRVRKYLSAVNPSMPNGISHSKFLVLLSALQSYFIDDDERKILLTIHHRAFADGFYSKRLASLM